ncbi:putative FHA domain-containing protein [Gammaproteobacteria bacterium]
MTDYVRICPRCGQINPEYDNLCTTCLHFIGMEEAVPASTSATVADGATHPADTTTAPTTIPSPIHRSAATMPPSSPTPQLAPLNPIGEPLTQRFVPTEPSLFLEVAKDKLLPVHPGWRLGQAYSSNDAEIQLPAQLVGVEFVHRYHCCFDHDQGRWYVTALDQRSLARDFTNPTYINGRLLPPGERSVLTDGDELRLSGVRLWVRIPLTRP